MSGRVSQGVGMSTTVAHEMMFRQFAGGSLASHCLALSKGQSVLPEGQSDLPGVCFG